MIKISPKDVWDGMGDDEKFGLTQEMQEHIEALQAEVQRLHDKYDFQLLVKKVEKYEMAIATAQAADVSREECLNCETEHSDCDSLHYWQNRYLKVSELLNEALSTTPFWHT